MVATSGIDQAVGEPRFPDFCFPMGDIRGIDQVQRAKRDVRESIGQGNKVLHLNFDSVKGISSDIINFMIWCQMECNRNGVVMRVENVNPEMLRVFRFAGLNQVIEFNR